MRTTFLVVFAALVAGVGVTAPRSGAISAITSIHDIQGSGATSPLVATSVTTRGIVTALKSNGFFVQTADAGVDADPNTSEGIFVFTGSAPPATAVVGNDVSVTGTVTEFIPSSDPFSPSLTELTTPTVVLNSTGNPLPAPVALTAPDTLVDDVNNLERYEGMRSSVASLTVVEPTAASINEPSETATSTGVFYGVVTGVPRPFREPGIRVPDPLPPGAPPTVPRFDWNPERLRVDSDGQTGSSVLNVAAGALVTGLVGPLDYASRTYTLLPDPGSAPVASPDPAPTPAPLPTASEFTIASANLQRFYDTVDDPAISDPVLTVGAFNNRLVKASREIRSELRSPDVIGVQDVENLSTLQAIANRVNTDAVAAAEPNPNYQAYLVEGNDVTGVDVGFLVKTSRVSVGSVTQMGAATTYINPNNGLPELLNDRPPLVLEATISGGTPAAFTVIVNHLRSLSGIDDATDGNRVRTKRRAQAEYLANLIQARQAADPAERLVSLGDYNAYQFNDGYVDVLGTVKGTPALASQVVLASADLVNPDLVNLVDTLPSSERYSLVFDGNAAALDHVLVNSAMNPYVSRFAFARSNADFPGVDYGDPAKPTRLSDHDGAVAYFTLTGTTAVTLTSFAATRTARGVRLRWRTGSETRTLGFVLYRLEHGRVSKVTLVPGRSARPLGASYSFLDRAASVRGAVVYRLQAVNLDGTRAWLGSAAVAR